MATERTYELASIGDRLIALIIDSIIVSAVGGAIGAGGSGNFLWGGSITSFILGAGYQWYFLTQQKGQTPGKMLMKIRVIKTDGTRLTDADAILRYIGYLVNSAVVSLGWIWALFDKNNQGWHDKIAKTYVVKADPVMEDDTLYVYQPDEEKKKHEELY